MNKITKKDIGRFCNIKGLNLYQGRGPIVLFTIVGFIKIKGIKYVKLQINCGLGDGIYIAKESSIKLYT